MSVKLPAEVYSPDHIGIVLWELEQLIDHLRNGETRAGVVGATIDSEKVASAFLAVVLAATGVSATDRKALESLQAELKAVRDGAPVAHIILAALPGKALKAELVGWFRRVVHKQHLVTFAVRSDIGGGFLLRTGSRQYDFTYRTQLLESKHRLTEIFDSVR